MVVGINLGFPDGIRLAVTDLTKQLNQVRSKRGNIKCQGTDFRDMSTEGAVKTTAFCEILAHLSTRT
jgi:hypothetical protein